MGRVTLDEAKKSLTPEGEGKATKKGQQTGRMTRGMGRYVACRTRLGETPKVKANRGKGKAGTMNNNRRQGWRHGQTTERGSYCRGGKLGPSGSNGRSQKKKHTACFSRKETCWELTGKSGNWCRFQDPEQKVKRQAP